MNLQNVEQGWVPKSGGYEILAITRGVMSLNIENMNASRVRVR